MSVTAPPKPRQPNLDRVTTINEDGSRYFLHPADVGGRWTAARRVFGYLLLAVYIALPWIPINGNPAVLLDVAGRKFHVFGLTLVPQDLWVLFFGITGLGFALFFATALLGRLWCGWACPYTVFLDHIYRRIERLIDGDAPARRKLDAAPWTSRKLVRRGLKHGLYFLCSAVIAHVFLSYFVSLPQLYSYMQGSPFRHALAFGVVAFLTLALWFSFGWFREQFCIIMCPYGRIQSALTDDNTVIIGYDERRGEPRGHVHKSAGEPAAETAATAGHCIDCRRCVQVCPTGIDIRNGLQLECIGCAACIDACDEVMDKVSRPRGLIRYDSMTGLAGRKRRIVRPRIVAYTVLGLFGLSMLGFTALKRARPFTVGVTRMASAGAAPFFIDDAAVRNIYQLRFLNKRNQPASFTITLGEDAPPGFTLAGSEQRFEVPPLGELTRPCVVLVPRHAYPGNTGLTFVITADPGGVRLPVKVRFLGPDASLLQGAK
jgi:cytochrome c oxidase accessory protein FixG